MSTVQVFDSALYPGKCIAPTLTRGDNDLTHIKICGRNVNETKFCQTRHAYMENYQPNWLQNLKRCNKATCQKFFLPSDF